ncbi:hypothetical protein D3C77_581290 [compost metagenome]
MYLRLTQLFLDSLKANPLLFRLVLAFLQLLNQHTAGGTFHIKLLARTLLLQFEVIQFLPLVDALYFILLQICFNRLQNTAILLQLFFLHIAFFL